MIAERKSLITVEFIALNVMIFLCYCNLAVMFGLHQYFLSLNIDPRSIGILIGSFSLIGLLLRPIISPFLHPGNIRRCIIIAVLVDICVLLGYILARSFWPILIVRFLHGAAYVVMASAKVALLVLFIPSKRSGQAFGLFSASMILPLAIIPPVLDTLTKWFGGFDNVIALSGILMFLILPLLLLVKPDRCVSKEELLHSRHITRQEFIDNLKDIKVIVILVLTLVLFFCIAIIFSYMKVFGETIGIQNPGLFFTVAILTMVITRLTMGRLFDKIRKSYLLGISTMGLVIAYLCIPIEHGNLIFFLLAFVCGVCWGIAHPLLHTLLFQFSPLRLKGLNQNLGTEMVDGGFFFGPLLGGLILSKGSYTGLFFLCAALTIASLFLLPVVNKMEQRVPD